MDGLFRRTFPTTAGGPITTQELDFSKSYGSYRLPKATMVYHLKPKNHTDGPNVFQSTLGMLD